MGSSSFSYSTRRGARLPLRKRTELARIAFAALCNCTATPPDASGRCPPPNALCRTTAVSSATAYCVDLDDDPDHCGDCNTQCPDGQHCLLGHCEALRCVPNEVRCADTFTVRRCAASGLTYRDDPCPLDQVCQGGACRGPATRWHTITLNDFDTEPLDERWYVTPGESTAPCQHDPAHAWPCGRQGPERIDGRSVWSLRNRVNHLRGVFALPEAVPVAVSLVLRFPSPASTVELHLRGALRCFDATLGTAYVLRVHDNALQLLTPGGSELARRLVNATGWYTLRLEEDPLLGTYRLLLDGSALREGLLADFPRRSAWIGVRSTGSCLAPQLYIDRIAFEEGA